MRLDETYFYPAGGGQPADRGRIGDQMVKNVLQEDGQIWHYLEKVPAINPVECAVDPEWRHHFMCQHTGQHILSGALWQAGRFKTLSVHMGEETTTIETDAETISEEQLYETEDKANEIIRSNLPVKIIETHSDELSRFPLRKPAPFSGPLSLVSVGSFDFSVCCGLHLSSSGEIGLIKSLGMDKIRGHVRTSWLIGPAAARDYRRKHQVMEELKSAFSCGMDDMTQKAASLLEGIRELERKRSALEKRVAEQICEELLRSFSREKNGVLLVSGLFREEEKLIQHLVKNLLDIQDIVFCVLNQAADSFTWNIGCSGEVSLKFDKIRETLLNPFSAKGGGRAPLWKGVCPSSARAQEFIDRFTDLVRPQIRN